MSQKMQLKSTVSLLIPCYNEEASVSALLCRLESVCEPLNDIRWSLIFVNDGSTDNTMDILGDSLPLCASWCNAIIVDLSRNFGKEAALIAGLDNCESDACIIIDADLQDPPELIPQMIASWRDGYQIVNAKRGDRRSDHWLKRSTAQMFYWLFKTSSKLDVEINVSDFRLLDKVVIASICRCREAVRFSKGFFAWTGFAVTSIIYKRHHREAGLSKWGAWRLWNYGLDGILNFSTAPLRVFSYIGILVTAISFFAGLRITFLVFINGVFLPGYASLFVAITFLGGAQLIGLGIAGEYIGRIYMESKHRPIYLVRQIIKVK